LKSINDITWPGGSSLDANTAYDHSQDITGGVHGATNNNTANMIVRRDASGNFNAGIITAVLSGNASTATKLQTARTINGVSFDGSTNITIADSTKEPIITKNTAFNINFETTATNIKMNGTQSLGSLSTVARADHVHPIDTSRASTVVATTGTNGLMSSTDKTKLDGIASGAEVNVQSDWNATSGDAFILNKPTLGTASSLNTGTSSGNIPVLDTNGKLDTLVLPGLALTTTNVVATQTAMLALIAEPGDLAVRTDLNKTFILKTAGASTLTNWQELLTPTDSVTSVAGKTGIVTLSSSDIGLGNVTNESKVTMFTSPVLTGTPTAPTAIAGTNTTQLATTAFVTTAVANKTTILGNAGTATKLETARTISLSGDVTGSVSFDGSTNASITATVADNSHKHDELAPLIIGTQVASTSAWTGTASNVNALYDGLSIRYWLPRTSTNIAVTLELTLSDGLTTTGAIDCYYGGTTRLTTHFGAGNLILLTYVINRDINGTLYTGWWAGANYDSNTYDRTYWNNTITAGQAIYDYKLIMQGLDGKFYPLTLEAGTGTTKTISTQEFEINTSILFYNSTTDITVGGTTGNVYSEIPITVLNYTANQASWASQLPVYLKGIILPNGNFKLDNTTYTSFMTQTLPTSPDGFVYVLLGYMYSTTGMRLFQYHPMYEFRDGYLRVYMPYHTHGNISDSGAIGTTANLMIKTSTNGILTTLPQGSSGQFLRYDGTWSTPSDTIYTHPTGDGNLHVPATGTTNNGKVLTAGAIAGSLSWTDLPTVSSDSDTVDGKHASDFMWTTHPANIITGLGTSGISTDVARADHVHSDGGGSASATIFKSEEFIATAGQTVFTLTTGTYTINAGRMNVYLFGIKQPPTAFTETNSTTVTLTAGVDANTLVLFEWCDLLDGTIGYPTHGSTHITGGGDTIPNATKTSSGLMSATNVSTLATHETTLAAHETSLTSHEASLNAMNATDQVQTAMLKHGQNLIHTDRSSLFTPTFNGRTLINLFGKAGNFENTDLTTINRTNTTVSLDAADYVFGKNSLNVTATATTGSHIQWFISNNTNEMILLTPGKYYFVSGYIKAVLGKAKLGMRISNSANTYIGITYDTNLSESPTFKRTGFKYQANTGDSYASPLVALYDTNGASSFAGAGENSSVDGVAVYEISAEDYVLTIDQLLDKYSYIDSYQTLQNPYIVSYGKNLLPPFSDWDLFVDAKATDSYELTTTTATSNAVLATVKIPVIEGQQYTIACGSMTGDGTKRFRIGVDDGSSIGVFLTDLTDTKENVTFTIPVDCKMIIVVANNYTSAGTSVFANPMLNIGSTVLPFEPRDKSYLYTQTMLADGESLEEIDGKWVKTKKIEHVVLDGSLTYATTGAGTGWKHIQIPGQIPNKKYVGFRTEYVTKYDGKILNNYYETGIFTGDTAWISSASTDDSVYIDVSSADSGWGDAYTPTADEIKAYFYGWKMYTDGQLVSNGYNGSGTKRWVRRIDGVTQNSDSDYMDSVTTVPTTLAPNFSPYQLHYQLATPTTEVILTEGDLILIEGDNQIELGEGIVFREVVTPILDTAPTPNVYRINNATTACQVQYFTENKLVVYKNGELDPKWVNTVRSTTNGTYATCSLEDYDPLAIYSVTYFAKPYQLTASSLDQLATYATNDHTVLQDVIKSISNIKSDLANYKVYQEQISNRNLLHNWDFRNPVNQRGAASYVHGALAYGLDRWKGYNLTATINSDSVNLTSAQTAVYKRMTQMFETVYTLKAGTIYTLTILAKINTLSGTVWLRPCNSAYSSILGTLGLPLTSSMGGYKYIQYTFAPTTDVSGFGVEILANNTANDYFDIDIQAWKFEVGSKSTLASDYSADYAEQFTLCQRYFKVCKMYSSPVFIGDTDQIGFPVPEMNGMRINPTFSSPDAAWYIHTPGETVPISIDPNIISTSWDCGLFKTVTGIVSGKIYSINTASQANNFISAPITMYFSAEI
jgi:hypothetical protein